MGALPMLLLLTVPLTALAGVYLLDYRQFLITAMLILIQGMIPFIVMFEGRKPAPRELVTIAVLCAMAVAGRAAFFMLPQVKPMAAMVIVSGIALGKETGFLIGAASALLSNMFFGQGPWTPWQMFALGLIGFAAGAVFSNRKVRRIPLAIFGGVATLVIFGGIMNPASVLMFQPQPTLEMLVTAYIVGIPFDAVHGLATAVFLFFIGIPLLEKLERIKIKYGGY